MSSSSAMDISDCCDPDSSSLPDPAYLSLEQELVTLLKGKTLHWRHEQMCLAAMLMLVGPG